MSTTPFAKELHITVGVYPATDGNLTQDIKLIKAALLYADKVTIYSPTASVLQIATRLSDLSDNEQLEFMEMVAPYVGSSTDSTKLVENLRKLRDPHFSRSPQGKMVKSALLKQLASSWSDIKRVIADLAETAGMSEIDTALGSGMLEIHQFATQSDNSHVIRFMADCVVKASGKQIAAPTADAINRRDSETTKEFVEGVCSAVTSGLTYPLFDKDTGELVSSAYNAGYILTDDASQRRARHIALAHDLFQRLPVFDRANMKDVLLVRKELDKHLIRFRKSVIEFTSTIASSPWDNDFEKEAELLFRKEVAPAMLDLEDEIKSNNFLGQLVRKVVDTPLTLAPGAALSLVLSTINNLPHEIASALGIGVGGAALVYDAYREWSEKQRTIEHNGVYFYYQTNKKLEELS